MTDPTTCPCCDSDKLRKIHGATLEPTTDGVECSRCGLVAIDVADAREHVVSISDGRRLDLMYRDAIEGRVVDPIEFARAMGRYHCGANPDGAGDGDGPLIGMLCEVAHDLRTQMPDDPPNPWRAASDFDVARMVVAALNAAGFAVVAVRP